MERDGGRYYGPFTSAYAVRQTLDVLRRVFPYLDCTREITGRDPKPCLYYHIKRCAGPCIGAVDQEGYRQVIAGLGAFLEGDSEAVLAQLTERMQAAAENLQFERAALLRDQIRAASQIVERQKVVSGTQEDEDVIAFAQDARTGEACVQVFFIRRGKLIGRENFVLEGVEPDTNGEMMSAFVKQFYDEAAFVPPSIVLQKDLDERTIIEQWLRGRRNGQKVVLTVPTEGPKLDLLQLATENAAATLTALQAQWQADTNRQTEALAQIQDALGITRPAGPHRVLRHFDPAGHPHGGQHGRLRQRRAGQGRLPAVQHQGPRQPGRAGRFCLDARGVAPPLPPRGRGGRGRSRQQSAQIG